MALVRTWPRICCQRSGWMALATFIGSIDLPGGSAASWDRIVSWIGEVMGAPMPRIVSRGETGACARRRLLLADPQKKRRGSPWTAAMKSSAGGARAGGGAGGGGGGG